MATTLNLTVAAGSDDARERNDGTNFNGTATTVDVTSDPTAGSRWNGGFLFDPIAIPNAATIDTATWDDMHGDWGMEDADDPANFVTTADVTTRVGSITTALVAWVADAIGTGFNAMPGDFKAPVQEIVDRAGWASGQAMTVLGRGNSDAAKIARLTTVEGGQPAKLDITYSVAAGLSIPIAMHHYKQMMGVN